MSENNQVYNDEQFCYDVLDSELNPIEKIQKLNAMPQGSSDIVGEMIKFGPYLENYFEDKTVFFNNENIIDFIGGTVSHFEAMAQCVKELNNDEDYKELRKANSKYIMTVSTAAELVEKYFALYDIWENKSGTADEFYRVAMSLVEMCADYFKNAHILYNNDVVYYRFGQKALIEKFINGDSESSSKNAVKENSEDTSKNDSPTNAKVKSISKKLPAPLLWLSACGGVSLILTLVALFANQSVFNYILAVIGIAELVVAFVLFNRTSKIELLTCRECGGQREEVHRRYVNTTKHEKHIDQNPNKSADESIRYIYSYTHHYISTYTCKSCGCTVEKNTTDGGGCVTIYYSDRRKDTRTQPREF